MLRAIRISWILVILVASLACDQAANITFVNRTDEPIRVYWEFADRSSRSRAGPYRMDAKGICEEQIVYYGKNGVMRMRVQAETASGEMIFCDIVSIPAAERMDYKIPIEAGRLACPDVQTS
jgi:hypothetical protein